jgi:hypothetical protein
MSHATTSAPATSKNLIPKRSAGRVDEVNPDLAETKPSVMLNQSQGQLPCSGKANSVRIPAQVTELHHLKCPRRSTPRIT